MGPSPNTNIGCLLVTSLQYINWFSSCWLKLYIRWPTEWQGTENYIFLGEITGGKPFLDSEFLRSKDNLYRLSLTCQGTWEIDMPWVSGVLPGNEISDWCRNEDTLPGYQGHAHSSSSWVIPARKYHWPGSHYIILNQTKRLVFCGIVSKA